MVDLGTSVVFEVGVVFDVGVAVLGGVAFEGGVLVGVGFAGVFLRSVTVVDAIVLNLMK